jgi:hypothetical protein
LNFTYGFRLVLVPNYLLMTLIRVSIIGDITIHIREPLGMWRPEYPSWVAR